MTNLIEFDWALFLFINHLPHTTTTDFIGLVLTAVGSYGLVWFVIALMYGMKSRRKFISIYPLILAIIICQLYVEVYAKPIIARLRPEAYVSAIIVDHATSGYSFPSNHAAMAWAGAAVMSTFQKKNRYWLYLLALGISLSRVYVGKHYPLDVAAGGIVGYFVGKLSLWTCKYLKISL